MIKLINKTKQHVLNKLAYYTNSSFAKPELFYLKLTNHCNFKCKHCDIWKNKDTKDLTLDDWSKAIKNLKNFCHEITISGGEPLLYPNFWGIITLLQKQGIKINLNTNGSLITEEISKKIFENKFNKVEISLYSLSRDKHNSFRNTNEAFDKTLLGIQNLLKYKGDSKTKILIAYLLNKDNLEETLHFIKKFTDKNVWVTIQALDSNIQTMTKRNDFHKETKVLTENNLWPKDKKKINSLFDKLIRLKKKGFLIYNRNGSLEQLRNYYLENFKQIQKLNCYCGQNNFIISTTADIHFCFDGPTMGNLVEKEAKVIWKSQKANSVRKQIKKCDKLCRIMNCNYNASLFSKIIEYIKK